MEYIDYVRNGDIIIAIIIRSEFFQQGIHFFTPHEFSQQLAYMNRDKGYVIPPHVHNPVHRDVFMTLEALYIKSGTTKVDFFTPEKAFLESRVLVGGDFILLASGGHGFTMIEPTEIIEIKQGPYAGDQDKTRFDPHVKPE